MININKKQLIIFIFIISFIILTICIFLFKSYNSSYDIIDSENILENNLSVSDITNTDNNEDSNLNNSNMTNSSMSDELIEGDYIVVHITGAITNPGIVKLKDGDRIADAISQSGGFTSDADISAINLAYKLDDGQKIYIPYKGENSNFYVDDEYISSSPGKDIISDIDSSYNSSYTKKSELININSATQTELETIPGIGPSTALKIIEYRKQNGKFNSIDDLKNISGIGESKFENMKPYISVK